MKVKKCKICEEIKPADQFSKDHRMTDNLTIYCKACRAEKTRINKAKKRDPISIVCQSFF